MPIVFGFLAPYIREADFAVRQPWLLGPRRLHDYLLIYVQSGEFAAYVDGREHTFRPGEFCLIQPGMRHVIEGRTDTITPYAHLDLYYDPANAHTFPVSHVEIQEHASPSIVQPQLRDLLSVDVPVTLQPDDPVRFRDVLIRMVGTWQHGDMLSRLEANHLASELIVMIARAYGDTSGSRANQFVDAFSWITAYLSFHLSDPLSVTDMADRAGLSTSRFSALFRQHFGCSPYKYLRRLRISHAQDLLTETDLTLDVIAERCGFANAQHLAKSFLQTTGETSGSYRRRTRTRHGTP